MRSTAAGSLLSLGILVALVVLSPLLGDYWCGFFARCISWMFLATSFVIAYSYANVPSLAQSTIFAFAAYNTAWWAAPANGDVLALLSLGTLSGTVLATLLGLLMQRMSRNGASIATIIIAVIAFSLGNALVPVTGGENGLALPTIPYSLLGEEISIGSNKATLILSGVLLIALLSALWALSRTHLWRVVRAVQLNETRARVLGYNASLYRLGMFTLSGFVAGLGGALYALISLHLTSGIFNLSMSFKAILWAVVGGVGSIFSGPIGVIAVELTSELLARWTYRVDMIIGVLLVFTALLLPRGVIGLIDQLQAKILKKPTPAPK